MVHQYIKIKNIFFYLKFKLLKINVIILNFQRKESSGGIIMEDPIAMQHWRGPRAFSNRYEGWDSDRAPQVINLINSVAWVMLESSSSISLRLKSEVQQKYIRRIYISTGLSNNPSLG